MKFAIQAEPTVPQSQASRRGVDHVYPGYHTIRLGVSQSGAAVSSLWIDMKTAWRLRLARRGC